MPIQPNTFCHYCGERYAKNSLTQDGYLCTECGNTFWQNATAVAVLIVPCGVTTQGENGVFAVRRAIEPFQGQLALPGGHITHTPLVQETWQQAACRETAEEIQVICRHDSVFERPEHLLTESSYSEKRVGDRVLVVGVSGGAFHIGEFVPSREALERVMLFPDSTEQLCFPIHRKALAMHWNKLGVAHNVQM